MRLIGSPYIMCNTHSWFYETFGYTIKIIFIIANRWSLRSTILVSMIISEFDIINFIKSIFQFRHTYRTYRCLKSQPTAKTHPSYLHRRLCVFDYYFQFIPLGVTLLCVVICSSRKAFYLDHKICSFWKEPSKIQGP